MTDSSQSPSTSLSNTARLVALSEALAGQGLNLARVLTADELEAANIRMPVTEKGIYLLLGNGGGAFWQQFEADEGDGSADGANANNTLADRLFAERKNHPASHPVDTRSEALLLQALQQHLPRIRYRVLFPQHLPPGSGVEPQHMPLQQLGQLAGWHQPSPLGSGMHQYWGLWYAYRVFVWLEIEPGALSDDPSLNRHPLFSTDSSRQTRASESGLSKEKATLSEHCLTCASRACISACPGEALAFGSNPDMQACTRYRCGADSACADRCLAREACPVGSAASDSPGGYPRAQISYHYRVALESLRVWYAELEQKPAK